MPPLGPVPPGAQLTFRDRWMNPEETQLGALTPFDQRFRVRSVKQDNASLLHRSDIGRDKAFNGRGIEHDEEMNHEIVGPFYGSVTFGPKDDRLHLKDFSGKARVDMNDGNDRVMVDPSANAPHDLEVHGSKGKNHTDIISTAYKPGMNSNITLYNQGSVSFISPKGVPGFEEVPQNQWRPEDRESGLTARYTNKHGMTVNVFNDKNMPPKVIHRTSDQPRIRPQQSQDTQQLDELKQDKRLEVHSREYDFLKDDTGTLGSPTFQRNSMPIFEINQSDPKPSQHSRITSRHEGERYDVNGEFYGRFNMGKGKEQLRFNNFSGDVDIDAGKDKPLNMSLRPSEKSGRMFIHGGNDDSVYDIHATRYKPGEEGNIFLINPKGTINLHNYEDNMADNLQKVPEKDWTDTDRLLGGTKTPLRAKYTNPFGMNIYVLGEDGREPTMRRHWHPSN